ncbi:MAG: MFS transporter [Rhodocyclaceae bacterium]|nr:MFS transporter [Rhodocyclaceae bacterium]
MPAFLLSSLLAFLGGHMVNYTVILYLQERVGSDVLAGIGFGLSFGSSILFGWFAGVAADRLQPARLIHVAHLLFMICLSGLYWAETSATDSQRIPATLVSAFFGGLGWSFFGPARLATLGQIADPARLKPMTILYNLQVLIGFGLAPLVIGLVRSHGNWTEVIVVAMSCYVVSSLLLATTRTAKRPAHIETKGILAEIGEGFSAVGANRLLLQLMCAAIIGFAMTGPLQILLPRLAKEVLGLNEAQRGAFLGLMAIALILGGILALPLSKRVHHGKTIFIGLVVGGLVFASLSVWRNPVTASLALVGVGMAGGFVISLVVAGIQHQAPELLRGRIMSMYSIVSQVIPAASGVIAGIVLKSAGVVNAVWLEGLALVALAIIGALLMPTLRRQAQ